MVHDTASRYLCHTGRIRVSEAHAQMAIFCSRYLTSHAFAEALQASTIHRLALDGYYGLCDYACVFWQHHVQWVLANQRELDADLKNKIIQFVNRLLEVFCRTGLSNVAGNRVVVEDLNEGAVRSGIEEWQKNGNQDSFLVDQITSIRKVIESIDLNTLHDHERTGFEELNGIARFKCPKIKCSRFAVGFSSAEMRRQHMQEHDRPFKCQVESCYARTIGYSSQLALDGHHRRLHASDQNTALLFPKTKGSEPLSINTAASKGDLEAIKTFHQMAFP
ncbi:hypothetical protein ABW20_dc0108013 [Dactylellina cionopaga]|nr:hypothetical protein ABW20_dc0108013 [Dactylellina cionopaga]